MSIPDLIIRNQILCANRRGPGQTNGPTKNPLLDDVAVTDERAAGDKLEDSGEPSEVCATVQTDFCSWRTAEGDTPEADVIAMAVLAVGGMRFECD